MAADIFDALLSHQLPANNSGNLQLMEYRSGYNAAIALQARMQQNTLYALLDPIEREFDVPGISAKAANETPAQGCCLYQGEAAEQYGHFTPHIVQVTPQYQDIIWQKCLQENDAGWGYFFTSTQPLNTLRRHFKRWLTVNMPNRRQAMFRQQDARIHKAFTLASNAQEQALIFGPVNEFIYASSQAISILSYPNKLPSRWPIAERFLLRDTHVNTMSLAQQAHFLSRAYQFINQQMPAKIAALSLPLTINMLWSQYHKAQHYNFTSELEIVRYISLAILWGADFDTEIPQVTVILGYTPHENSRRLEQLYELYQQQAA